MNWKNISNYHLRTSTLATQFTGGWADEVNFLTSFSWLVMFYAFLVSRLTIFVCTVSESEVRCLQVPLLPLRGSSQVVETPYLFGVLVFNPIPFVPSCSSRNNYTFPVPLPNPPSPSIFEQLIRRYLIIIKFAFTLFTLAVRCPRTRKRRLSSCTPIYSSFHMQLYLQLHQQPQSLQPASHRRHRCGPLRVLARPSHMQSMDPLPCASNTSVAP